MPPNNYPDWTDPSLPPALRWCSRLAFWMDDGFKLPVSVPFLGKRIGLDALTGILPIAGDALGLAVGMVPIGIAIYWRLPITTIAAMAVTVAIDFFAGSIPVIGDMFDAGFKANRKNVQLLHKAWKQQQGELSASQQTVNTSAKAI